MIDKVKELLKELEWSGLHTDYEDSWGVMTRACPSCFNAKDDGHKTDCKLNFVLKELENSPNIKKLHVCRKNPNYTIGLAVLSHACVECPYEKSCG